jgi:hypothetical protein
MYEYGRVLDAAVPMDFISNLQNPVGSVFIDYQ